MKLLNQTLWYVSISTLGIVSIWAVIFYFNMLQEIKSSIDEGLENSKRIIIQNAQEDSTILSKKYFDESFFTISSITRSEALSFHDTYQDTVIYMQDADDQAPEPEPVRLLTTAFEIDGKYYQLHVANSMVEEDDLIKELLWDVIWLYLVLLVSMIVIHNLVLKKLWKPFYQLLHQLKKFRLGKTKDLPHVSTQTKEFLDLQQAVNTLLQHSISTFEQQKEFIGNASHELQTPLAMLTGKLELLLEKESLQAEDAEKVSEIFQIIQRLIKLNKSLLLLSKIENKQFLDNQEVSINQACHQILEEFEEIAAVKQIEISLEELGEVKVSMDPNLAITVLSNLLKNAISHNQPRGRILIKIHPDRLIISNSGISQPLAEELIFHRFHKSESTASGTGLGLAIVKAICKLYSFEIEYRYAEDLHHFELRFF
ncbi:sensor histidine kinase [Algoriphagus vanfongensis]|uniref:sensor histidine kinase n=1 Tax=Algoriphagus vanfongensis TaxID=426371 RepID=UPI00040879E9|nr:HAMP domain-containing sensor histidine kinase [Algoriphagus vanfongensis]